MTVEKVKIAIIGLGRIARTHIDAIEHFPELCELTAVVDIKEDLAKSYGEEFNVPYYTSVEKCLEDPNVDAVVICLQHDLHEPISVQASNAGKHVLVEKVMATSVEEGLSMVEAAKNNNKKLMVAQSRRYFQAFHEARKHFHKIGKITNSLYNFTCFFDKDIAPQWWQSKEATGGLAYPMLGSHAIDITLWMLDDRDPVSVFASGVSNNPDFEGHDDITIIIGFNDGTQATCFLGTNNRYPKHEGHLIGKEGSIFWSQTGDHVGLIGTADTDLIVNGERIMTGESIPHNFAIQMKEFVDSIIEDREPLTSGEKIITQLRIIEAAQRSAVEKRVIMLEDSFTTVK
ncbi:Gfo/Idh/MocA family oxidoreductase [Niallia oryzisoli]|uniref:Gfo/Idh/MocA family oxidoreductase n=1 Tax=Niallia oryzisoli TaxID=1737571 RepID=A0ABZ2CCC5_9BACI